MCQGRTRGLADPPLSFSSSRWFTRGWTLQELLAPDSLEFYASLWVRIEYRSELGNVISRVTSIPAPLLGWRGPDASDPRNIFDYSLAQRMSWASARRCTRVEDRAYCLLGIFGINMPLLYGEGPRAFIRLQEEIWKETDDHSLLAWTLPQYSPKPWHTGGVFAESPSHFASSGHVVRLHGEIGDPSVITKKGVQISLCLQEKQVKRNYPLFRRYHPRKIFYAALNCGRKGSTSRVAILLVEEQMQTTKHRLNDNLGLSRCYIRLMTPTHLRVEGSSAPDLEQCQAVFLRTHRHQLVAPHEFSRLKDVIVHLHGIPVHYLRDHRQFLDEKEHPLFNERLELANRVSDTGLEFQDDYFGYSTDKLSYRTNGFLGYGPECEDFLYARGDFFELRMEMCGQGCGQSPILVTFGFDMRGKGWIMLILETEQSTVRPEARIFESINIGRCKGDLMEASATVGRACIAVKVYCEDVWEYNPVAGTSGCRTHLHLVFSCHLGSSYQMTPTMADHYTIQAWRIRDFYWFVEELLARTNQAGGVAPLLITDSDLFNFRQR